MMRPTIIRGIWGSPEVCGRDRFRKETPSVGWQDLWASVEQVAAEPVRYPCDLFVTFGRDNTERAERLGLQVYEASRLPWIFAERELPPSEHRYPAAVHRGVNGHHHKLAAIVMAVEELGPVLWFDLRVRQTRPLDDSWWHQLGLEPDFRAAMIRQYNPRFGAIWRYQDGPSLDGIPQWPLGKNRHEAQWLPGGGCLYAGDSSLLRRALQLGRQWHWWSDQQLLAAAIDERHGKWLGERRWSRLYGLTGYYYGRNRHYSEPQDTYFECGRRLGKAEHRWRLWR